MNLLKYLRSEMNFISTERGEQAALLSRANRKMMYPQYEYDDETSKSEGRTRFDGYDGQPVIISGNDARVRQVC